MQRSVRHELIDEEALAAFLAEPEQVEEMGVVQPGEKVQLGPKLLGILLQIRRQDRFFYGDDCSVLEDALVDAREASFSNLGLLAEPAGGFFQLLVGEN